jgi:hypothetical protein
MDIKIKINLKGRHVIVAFYEILGIFYERSKKLDGDLEALIYTFAALDTFNNMALKVEKDICKGKLTLNLKPHEVLFLVQYNTTFGSPLHDAILSGIMMDIERQIANITKINV